jgi:hypothetical protein
MALLFSIRADPFSGVCPYHFYGICNEQELASACVYGKITQVLTSPIYQRVVEVKTDHNIWCLPGFIKINKSSSPGKIEPIRKRK